MQNNGTCDIDTVRVTGIKCRTMARSRTHPAQQHRVSAIWYEYKDTSSDNTAAVPMVK